MRFGRIILAALAPLLSLPVMGGDVAHQDVSQPTATDSRIALLRSMVLFAVSAAESGSPAMARVRPAAQALFALSALLVSTNFKHSLWLMTSTAAFDLAPRQHRRVLLRC